MHQPAVDAVDAIGSGTHLIDLHVPDAGRQHRQLGDEQLVMVFFHYIDTIILCPGLVAGELEFRQLFQEPAVAGTGLRIIGGDDLQLTGGRVVAGIFGAGHDVGDEGLEFQQVLIDDRMQHLGAQIDVAEVDQSLRTADLTEDLLGEETFMMETVGGGLPDQG